MPHDTPSTETQLALLVHQLGDVRHEIAEVRALIEGPPFERSLRGRMHRLEAEGAAAALASATLAEARRERRQAQLERARGGRTTRAYRFKVVASATGIALALYPYIAHFSHWGG